MTRDCRLADFKATKILFSLDPCREIGPPPSLAEAEMAPGIRLDPAGRGSGLEAVLKLGGPPPLPFPPKILVAGAAFPDDPGAGFDDPAVSIIRLAFDAPAILRRAGLPPVDPPRRGMVFPPPPALEVLSPGGLTKKL